jgi:hypothetical protein
MISRIVAFPAAGPPPKYLRQLVQARLEKLYVLRYYRSIFGSDNFVAIFLIIWNIDIIFRLHSYRSFPVPNFV